MEPKKGGKKKLPVYWSEPVDSEPFGGLKARDLIKTPLGIIGTILGVKLLPSRKWNPIREKIEIEFTRSFHYIYETKERGEPGTGTMWVQYANGFLSPLAPDFSTSGYKGFEGYQRLSDGDHLWRDIKEFHQAREAGEDIRDLITVDNDKYVAALVVEWEKKQRGQKKKDKGKKKKK